jgi:hypothetical protein
MSKATILMLRVLGPRPLGFNYNQHRSSVVGVASKWSQAGPHADLEEEFEIKNTWK